MPIPSPRITHEDRRHDGATERAPESPGGLAPTRPEAAALSVALLQGTLGNDVVQAGAAGEGGLAAVARDALQDLSSGNADFALHLNKTQDIMGTTAAELEKLANKLTSGSKDP